MSAADSHASTPAEQPPAPGPKEAQAPAAAPTSDADFPKQLGLLILAVLMVGYLYWDSITEWITIWDKDPNYSHGFVVPVFAALLGYLAFLRHDVTIFTDDVTRRSVIVGGVEIGFGLLLHFAALFLGVLGPFLDVIALIFIVLGIIMVLGGKKANRAYGFPVFFLIFMAPLPAYVYNQMALPLQNFASIMTVGLFDLFGIPAFRSGYRIDIPGEHDMLVGEACSGLRSLTAILALAFAIAYLSGRSMTYRSILVALAAPVAIAVNCLRVFGTGLIMIYAGPQWAQGDLHEQEGMIMIGVAALLLVFVAWLLAGMEDWIRERKDASDSPKPDQTQEPPEPSEEAPQPA